MKKMELLAPAGNMNAMKAAVAAGCDAVYLGLQSFSARAFAGNFSREEFQEAIRYCHMRDVRIYVTMNTLLFEEELEAAFSDLDFLYENDCDALLVQDLGLLHYIRSRYPDFAVHCSTQMHIHNIEGVRFMQKQGVSRVVLARETPIEIIEEACQTGMEIEVFVYGAACISYSGQCLMSEAVKHRSANRGRCAQCCRLQYFPEKGETFPEGSYILSPKDLNMINAIPRLKEAGVSSLKIEGRMKREEYVYLAVKTFREAIDACYENRPYRVSAQREKELKLMFNRGFSQGHMMHATAEERMSPFRPNHQGIVIGTVKEVNGDRIRIALTQDLHQHDGLRIINEPTDTGFTVNRMYRQGKLTASAKANENVWVECRQKPFPKAGQKVLKTTDTELIRKTDEAITESQRSSDITVKYEAVIGKPLYVTITDNRGNCISACSEMTVQKAKNAPITQERLEEILCKTDKDPYTIRSITGTCEDIFLPVREINEVRRKAFAALNDARAQWNPRVGRKEYRCEVAEKPYPEFRIIADSDHPGTDSRVLWISERKGIRSTPVVRESLNMPERHEGDVIHEIGTLNSSLRNCIAGMTLNCSNSYALAFLLKQPGINAVILSSELSNPMIRETLSAFETRYGWTPAVYRLVYGKRTVMYIKKGFTSRRGLRSIVDFHGKKYELAYNENIVEILEPDPYRSDNPYCMGSFLIPDAQQEKEIEEAYEEIYGRI